MRDITEIRDIDFLSQFTSDFALSLSSTLPSLPDTNWETKIDSELEIAGKTTDFQWRSCYLLFLLCGCQSCETWFRSWLDHRKLQPMLARSLSVWSFYLADRKKQQHYNMCESGRKWVRWSGERDQTGKSCSSELTASAIDFNNGRSKQKITNWLSLSLSNSKSASNCPCFSIHQQVCIFVNTKETWIF